LDETTVLLRNFDTNKVVKEKLADQGIDAESSSAADFTKLIATDQKRWAAVIKAADIKPE
jgi:tripartite-type tricarboxylate transporter receptor subunit TctC